MLRYRPSRTQIGELLDEVRAAGLTIADLAIAEADLEAIFLRLTGARAAPEPASLSLMEQHTKAFFDKAHSVTLRVIYYGNDEHGQQRAYEAARHLEDMGFPVVNPIQKGKYVYVCVGAAPSKSDDRLMEYQRQLQLVAGPKPYGKPGDYASAFVYNIDKLVTR